MLSFIFSAFREQYDSVWIECANIKAELEVALPESLALHEHFRKAVYGITKLEGILLVRVTSNLNNLLKSFLF